MKAIHFLSVALTTALLAGGAFGADLYTGDMASMCPDVDPAQCDDPTFLDSACGLREREAWGRATEALQAKRAAAVDACPRGDTACVEAAKALLPGRRDPSSVCFRVALAEAGTYDEKLVMVPGCTGDQEAPCADDAGAYVVAKSPHYGREGQSFRGMNTHFNGLRTNRWTYASSDAPAMRSSSTLPPRRYSGSSRATRETAPGILKSMKCRPTQSVRSDGSRAAGCGIPMVTSFSTREGSFAAAR